MEIARLTRFLQLRYPQALSSLCNPLYCSVLCINLEELAKDAVRLNSYVPVADSAVAKQRIFSAALRLIDEFHPSCIVLYTDEILSPSRRVRSFYQDEYEAKFYQKGQIDRKMSISATNLAPKSLFLRETAKTLVKELQPLLGNNQITELEIYEDFNLVKYHEEHCSSPGFFVYGLSQAHKLEAIVGGLPISQVYEEREIFDKPVLDVAMSNVGFLEFGIVLQDIKLLRECIFCDMFSKWLNDASKTQMLVRNLGERHDGSAYSLQKAREYIFAHKIVDYVMQDFVLLVIMSGCDYLPEMPGQTFKNGVLDEFIDVYKEKCICEFPFRHLVNADSTGIAVSLLGDFLKILIRFESLWALSDVRDLIKMAHNFPQDSDFGRLLRNELEQFEAMVPRDEWQRLNSPHAPKEMRDSLFPNTLKKYRSLFYEKIEQTDDSLRSRPPTDFLTTESRRTDLLALYDHMLNLQKTPHAETIEKILEKEQLGKRGRSSVEFARGYLEELQKLTISVLQNKLTPAEHTCMFAPCATTLYLYCKLEQAESQNKQISDILWEYKGPVFEESVNSGNQQLCQFSKQYERFPPSMKKHFIEAEKNATCDISDVVAINCTSAFRSRDQILANETPNFSALIPNCYEFPNFGFQLISIDDRSVIAPNTQETDEDDLFLNKVLTPIHVCFTKSGLAEDNIEFVFSSLQGEHFQLANSVKLYVFQKSGHMFTGKSLATVGKVNHKQLCSVKCCNSKSLALLLPNIDEITKENGKFNVVCNDYQAPTLVLHAAEEHNEESEDGNLFNDPSMPSELIDCKAIPEDILDAIERHFSQEISQILRENVIFSSLDVMGSLYGICCDNVLYCLENDTFLVHDGKWPTSCKYSIEEFLEFHSDLYFSKHKAIVSSSSILFLLKTSNTQEQTHNYPNELSTKREEPFIAACSIYDNCTVVPVPLCLLEINNFDKIADRMILEGKLILRSSDHNLQNKISKLRFWDVTEQNSVLQLAISPENAAIIASQLCAEQKFVPVQKLRELVVEADAIVQDDLEFSAFQLSGYPSQLDLPVTAEYISREIEQEVTDDEISLFSGVINVACEDNAIRQFGLAAVSPGLRDAGLLVDERPTYRGAILIIAFAKAFPNIFSVLVKRKGRPLTESAFAGVRCVEEIAGVSKRIFPYCIKDKTATASQTLQALTEASLWLFGLPCSRCLLNSREALSYDLIGHLLSYQNILTQNNPFVINLYESKHPLEKVQLMQEVFAEGTGIGVVVRIYTRSFVIVCEGEKRVVWPEMQRIWLLKELPSVESTVEPLDFSACNTIDVTAGSVDKWLGTHYEINY